MKRLPVVVFRDAGCGAAYLSTRSSVSYTPADGAWRAADRRLDRRKNLK
jgi:hypothetical protein